MRKLIVLIMTSVLATGAVANADTVKVTKNPSDFIKIVDIKNNDGGSLLAGGMDPYAPGASANYQRLEVVVDDPDNELTQVSACIFDADVITDPDETDCGNGFENPETYNTSGGSAPPRSAATGAFRPESLIQMSFLPGLAAGQNDADNSVNVVLPETDSNNPFNHKVTEKVQPFGANVSWVQYGRNFDDFDNPVAANPKNAYRISFRFAVLFAAKHGDKWKVRVVATYRDSQGVDSNVELIGTDTDSVLYYGAFTELVEADFPTPETKRNAVTVKYGDVIQGGDSTVDNISTGSYLTNAASDISLSANVFSGTNSEGDLVFSGNATPASGQAGLGCRPISSSDPLEFFTNPVAGQSSSLVLLSSVRANSNPGVGDDPRDPIDAEKHECTFYAGDSVATGTYTNTVTVGIGES